MGEVWDLAKLGFDPRAPWSLCHGQWRVGSLLISKHLRQSPTHPDSCLPGLFLQLPWDHLEGHFHPQFWLPWLALSLASGGQGGLCPPTYTLRCPSCSVFVLLLAKHLACFLFQNVIVSVRLKPLGPGGEGPPDLCSPCFPHTSPTVYPGPVPPATVCPGNGDTWANGLSGAKGPKWRGPWVAVGPDMNTSGFSVPVSVSPSVSALCLLICF